MTQFTLTQEYLICTLNKKGTLSSYSQEALVCLVAGALLELQMAKCISIIDKKIAVRDTLPSEHAFLKPVYSLLNPKKPVRLQKILDKYTLSYTDKRMNTLIRSVMEPLKDTGAVSQVSSGIIRKRTRYVPVKEIREQTAGKIRSEVMEKDTAGLTEGTVALLALLDKAGRLKGYFSRHEQKELKNRLAEIKDSAPDKTVREMVYHAEIMVNTILTASGI